LIGFYIESYAVFQSAEAFPPNIKPRVISIKSVSDHGTSNKNNPYKKYHQSNAAYTYIQFFKKFVKNEI